MTRLRDIGTVTMYFAPKERHVDPLEERIAEAVGPTTARDVVEVLDAAGLRSEIWSLFTDWEMAEDQVISEFGVGEEERRRHATEVQARCDRLVSLIGEPPSTKRGEGVADPRAETDR